MAKKSMINLKDFQKIELKVGRILLAKKVGGSEKLVSLQIDLGSEKKQVVAGIGQFYRPEELIGKEIAVAVNLEPKVLFGLKSRGMILAADNEGKPVLLVPDKEVPPGTRIR